MKYKVTLSPEAKSDFNKLHKSDISAFKKVIKLIKELYVHPKTGIGKPKRLKGDRAGQWSRRINRKHRLVYMIKDDIVEVYVVSSYGHYEDK